MASMSKQVSWLRYMASMSKPVTNTCFYHLSWLRCGVDVKASYQHLLLSLMLNLGSLYDVYVKASHHHLLWPPSKLCGGISKYFIGVGVTRQKEIIKRLWCPSSMPECWPKPKIAKPTFDHHAHNFYSNPKQVYMCLDRAYLSLWNSHLHFSLSTLFFPPSLLFCYSSYICMYM